MRFALLVLLVGCGSSSKKPETAPTPTEKPVAEDKVELKAPPPEDKAPPVEQQPAEPVTAAELEPAGNQPTKSSTPSQAELSWKLETDGIDLAKKGRWADASRKFRDAVARVPEPHYFFNLCVAHYQVGKFTEALTACDAVANNGAPALKTKAERMSVRIKDEAKRQQIQVSP